MSKTIIFITNSFPYQGGEQFIETEILFYKDLSDRIILVPLTNNGNMREIPSNIEIRTFLAEQLKIRKSNFLKKVFFVLSTLKVKDFYKEILLNPRVLLSLTLLKALVSTLAHAYFIFEKLKNLLLKENLLNKDLVIYSYWFNHPAYAGGLIKRNFPFVRVITRAHRGDLYKYVTPLNHLKLKYFYGRNLDGIYSISEEGRRHLIENYGFREDKVFVSRLGILRHDYLSDFNKEDNLLHIISCSFLVPVKRLDKLIEILYEYGKRYPEKKVKWSHIGDGPLRSSLEEMAGSILGSLRNVSYNFIGHLSNSEVYKFYRDNKIDLFINVSESEGVPVSIMEAMSFGIPVVAPKVGGIPEIVDNETGILVEPNFIIDDIIEAIEKILLCFRSTEKRTKIKEKLYERYDAEKNYRDFIENVLLK